MYIFSAKVIYNKYIRFYFLLHVNSTIFASDLPEVVMHHVFILFVQYLERWSGIRATFST